MIESKYAEIVYFASPEYVSGTDTYIDNDGTIDFNANSVIDGEESRNGFPDRLRIHRRVLLIRPDLNITTAGRSNLGVMAAGSDPVIGLAETVHQQCDLSVRRILQDGGLPAPNAIAANSLTDLSKPHNRFAHYRIVGATGTSMPLLALGPAATILSDVALTNGTDMLHTSNESYVTPSVNGFLRPEFVLTGTRLGEDVSRIMLPDLMYRFLIRKLTFMLRPLRQSDRAMRGIVMHCRQPPRSLPIKVVLSISVTPYCREGR